MKRKKRLLREQARPGAEHKAAQLSVKRRPWLIILSSAIIALLAFIAYAHSLSATFVWDDEWLIKNNVYVTGPFSGKDIFTKDLGAVKTGNCNGAEPENCSDKVYTDTDAAEWYTRIGHLCRQD